MNFKRLERLEKRILEPERGENVYFEPADFSENEQAAIINCLDEDGQLKNLDCVPLELLKKILRLSEEAQKKPANERHERHTNEPIGGVRDDSDDFKDDQ